MIDRLEALGRVLGETVSGPADTVPLENALGRILARDVASDVDQPPFNKSSMDGYACRMVDIGAPLRVLEHIPAGSVPRYAIEPGTCAKIMTGAPVPEGADCVLMVEHVEPIDDDTVRYTRDETKPNICPRGEDVRVGDRLLTAGTRLTPAHLPVLASVGCTTPEVSAQPRVAVMATGDELVPPQSTPGAGKIRNSNSVQLTALAHNAGAIATDLGIVSDSKDAMVEAWAHALADHDVVLSTGGVSMGDYDLVPDILAHHGFTVHFDRVAIQPGKPVLFATRSEQVCFGLSGNPVSSFLQFMLFVTPHLWRRQGLDYQPREIQLPLGQDFRRRNGGREGWVPVRIADGTRVLPVEFHGSAHIHALTGADGLMAFPPGVTEMEAGRPVAVRLLDG